MQAGTALLGSLVASIGSLSSEPSATVQPTAAHCSPVQADTDAAFAVELDVSMRPLLVKLWEDAQHKRAEGLA